MNPALISELKNLIKAGLEDDSWGMDWTAISSSRKKARSVASVFAKSEGVWVGEGLGKAAESVAHEFGMKIEVESLKPEGSVLKSGQEVSRWTGESRAILAIERPFLNLASYMGGIALQTRKLVDRVDAVWKKQKIHGPSPRVTLTRKTLPHYRDIAIHSVILGGGFPHRVSLAGGVLIKENHIAVAGSVRKAIEAARAVAPHSLRVEIEVTNLKELSEAADAGAEIIMLDNFSPEQIRSAVKQSQKKGRKPILEVSGGIHEGNIDQYSLPGVDVISVGSITHSVRSIDLSLLMKR